jgi:hypothetical protein
MAGLATGQGDCCKDGGNAKRYDQSWKDSHVIADW